jgi:iron-sulfur cluster repair protein YtfE (RIC family)
MVLLAQHERLRDRVQACVRLASLYLGGGAGGELDVGLEELRDELAVHNQAETTVILRLLHGHSPCSAVLIDRMLEEHIAEHATFWESLSGTRDEVAARIDTLADELDAHMAAEERTFLSPIILDDRVARTSL